MSWGRVALWYVLALLLAVEYGRLGTAVEPTATGEPKAAPVRTPLLNLPPEALRALRLVHGPRVILLEREGAAWTVRAPTDAPIAPGLIDAFVSALSSAVIIDQVSDDATDVAPFGLDERAWRIEINPNAAGAAVLLVGNTNPTGTSVYARRGDGPQIYLIGRSLAYYEEMLFQALPPPDAPPATTGSAGE